MSTKSSTAGPFEPEEEIGALIRAVQAAILSQPVVAQRVYAALVAEGRRFSATPDGQDWKRRLEGSALVERGQALLDVASMGLLEENEGVFLPSRLLDALAIAIRERALEPILARAAYEL